jgi:hypothetical protein
MEGSENDEYRTIDQSVKDLINLIKIEVQLKGIIRKCNSSNNYNIQLLQDSDINIFEHMINDGTIYRQLKLYIKKICNLSLFEQQQQQHQQEEEEEEEEDMTVIDHQQQQQQKKKEIDLLLLEKTIIYIIKPLTTEEADDHYKENKNKKATEDNKDYELFFYKDVMTLWHTIVAKTTTAIYNNETTKDNNNNNKKYRYKHPWLLYKQYIANAKPEHRTIASNDFILIYLYPLY